MARNVKEFLNCDYNYYVWLQDEKNLFLFNSQTYFKDAFPHVTYIQSRKNYQNKYLLFNICHFFSILFW